MSEYAPQAPVCNLCLTQIAWGAPTVTCPACHAVYDAECWAENGGCGVYGCKESPAVEPRAAIEIPAGYWGRTDKDCPQCHRPIAAAAVRCRYCGATFASATPLDAAKYEAERSSSTRHDKLRKMAVIIFILCALPCTAPIGLIWGSIWYALKRKSLKALPPISRVLCLVGIGVALLETSTILLVSLAYGRTH